MAVYEILITGKVLPLRVNAVPCANDNAAVAVVSGSGNILP